MIEALISNLNQDIAILQHRVELDKAVGFSNMARLLEAMTIQLFRATGIADLKSKNQIKVNFPAIDSADEGKNGGIAVQVTSNANAAKIKKTIEAFEKKDDSGKSLKDRYAKLYIFGFCSRSAGAKLPFYCEVVGPDFFVDRLIDLHDEEPVQLVLDAVRRHVSYSSIHPYDDVGCLKIVLGYLGRDSVRHPMASEGSVSKMMDGLTQIVELVGAGTVNGRQKSKAAHEFQDESISSFLRQVTDHIGEIRAIVYRHRVGNNFACLPLDQKQVIDELKRSISSSAKSIAAKYGIVIPLDMHDVG